MHEEIGIFERFANWMAENWPWIAGVMGVAAMIGKKAFNFFQGINRLAASHEKLTELVATQKSQIGALSHQVNQLMTADGVDLRVAPVVAKVEAVDEKVDKIDEKVERIFDHLLDPSKKRRKTDP